MLDAILEEIKMEDSESDDAQSKSFQKQNKTILIVEDDDLLRKTVSRFLSANGYKVIEAENGAEALTTFKEERPELVLTDLKMPKMDGFELLEEIGKQSPHTPVIIFSGVGTKPDVINALRSGAWDYITKPIEDMNYLSDTIDKVIVQSQMTHGYHELMEKALKNTNEELERELKDKKILENQLLHAKREWENTVDSITEAIALVDKNSLLIRVNKAMAKILDANPADVIGKACYLSTKGFNNEQQALADQAALLRGEHLSAKFSNKEGSQVYEVTISPYHDHNDNMVVGAVYVARNITQRQS